MSVKPRRLISDQAFTGSKISLRESRNAAQSCTFYPCSAPGMPPIGPSFLAAGRLEADIDYLPEYVSDSQREGQEEERTRKITQAAEEFYRQALYNEFEMPVGFTYKDGPDQKAKFRESLFIPGSLWDKAPYKGPIGPQPADVMVIGKIPRTEEQLRGRYQAGRPIKLLEEVLKQYGVEDTDSWYITSLVRFLPPEDRTALRPEWIADCLPLLYNEIRLVKPKYIISLGADVLKALLDIRSAKLGDYQARAVPYVYSYHVSEEHRALTGRATLIPITHPDKILSMPQSKPMLEADVARLSRMIKGEEVDKEETGLDHHTVRNLDELTAVLELANKQCKRGLIAVDAEWHGEHPQNEGSYLRTIQFAWGPKSGACVVLRHAGGKPAFQPGIRKAIAALLKFFADKRVIGHFFAADLEWLIDIGLDLRPQFYPPMDGKADEAAWELTRENGGGDTALMMHSIEETASLGLESLTSRYTSAPMYHYPLDDWKQNYAKTEARKKGPLRGYGDIPEEILIPYGIYDVTVLIRIWPKLNTLLDFDYQGNSCREAYWRSMAVQRAVIEINTTGVQVDLGRAQQLCVVFSKAAKQLTNKLREWARWPEFKPNGEQHGKEFLFGKKYNGTFAKNKKIVRLRPPGARTLKLFPIFNTNKRPIPWAEIVAQGAEDRHSPSMKKEATALMLLQNPEKAEQIRWFRDLKFVNHVLSSSLQTDDDVDVTPQASIDFTGGVPGLRCSDGRVRTTIWPTKDTGRWSSKSPNLMAMSSSSDDNYVRILGEENYKHRMRSMIRASTKYDPGRWVDEDCVLIERDITGAELAVAAWQSGDIRMIDHVRRSGLPESDPEYFDMHSSIAVLAFRLNCPPTKAGLRSIGRYSLRNVAKAVAFGVMYGRGARAIAEAAKLEGLNLSVDEAQTIIDTFFGQYPGLREFLDECADRAIKEGWLCTPAGRFRRFPKTDDRKIIGDFQRKAKNFIEQSYVCDVMSEMLVNMFLYRLKASDPDLFRLVLQIHDAFVLEVPVSRVDHVVNDMFPVTNEALNVYPCRLDGMPTGAGPYNFSLVTKLALRWGEHLTKSECRKLGLNPSYGTGV